MKKLSIVVPMYNEEEVIELFYKETKKVVDDISKDYSKLNIIVDSEIFFASILIAPLLTKSPYTKVGKITYGLLIGLIGFILCYTLTIKEGLYIIILIASIFSKYFDLIESKLPKRRVKI